MVTSLYKEVLRRGKASLQELLPFLNNLGYEMFAELQALYPEVHVNSGIFYYILYAYSEESDYLLLRANWGTRKREIAAIVTGMGFDVPDEVVEVKRNEVNDIIARYLNKQGDSDFKHLKLMEDVIERIYDETFRTLNTTGEEAGFNRQELMDNLKELRSLQEQKDKKLEEVKDAYAYIYENLDEVKPVRKKERITVGIENSEHIRT